MINHTFKEHTFFYSSLGNSILFDITVLSQIEDLIISNSIREIVFVLADDNRMISDALANQDFSVISGLENFYHQIRQKKVRTEDSWQSPKTRPLILSFYLNEKIKELKEGLRDLFSDSIRISGKIYYRQKNIFKDIYLDLISFEKLSLN
ncbi:MAG: hypothetical protein AAGD28_12335 [Bacteroidota bacterium]